ncbi:MAG: DUF2080 family transposase-associated protein [Saprospiraceae bacterium]|nr:DUF2080 family transposase-associated protein [Saprospiraceae bacterium]MCC7148435.1 DUF2080 family transposase-associated protein [Saprospiraceae bacterium]
MGYKTGCRKKFYRNKYLRSYTGHLYLPNDWPGKKVIIKRKIYFTVT